MLDLRYYLQLYFSPVAWKKKLFTQRQKSIYDINFNQLKKKGFKAVIFDVDDTLRGHLDVIPQKTFDMLQLLHKKSFEIAFFSNMTVSQRKEFETKLKNIPFFLGKHNDKPNPQGFFDILKNKHLAADKVIMVGDRIGTDMFAAYLAGIKERILVEPYSKVFGALNAPPSIRIMRKIERLLFSN